MYETSRRVALSLHHIRSMQPAKLPFLPFSKAQRLSCLLFRGKKLDAVFFTRFTSNHRRLTSSPKQTPIVAHHIVRHERTHLHQQQDNDDRVKKHTKPTHLSLPFQHFQRLTKQPRLHSVNIYRSTKTRQQADRSHPRQVPSFRFRPVLVCPSTYSCPKSRLLHTVRTP